MPFIIFLLFIVLPFVELTLLLRLGAEIGAVNTIAVIVATGFIGGYLAKREGLSIWTRFQQKLAQGGMPGDELIDGLIILVSGALLVTPGVITDVVGFLGLLPPSRSLIKSQLGKRFVVGQAGTAGATFQTSRQWASGRVDPTPAHSSAGDGVDITELVEKNTEKPSA
jgi:UPF0716 family protein affecting phage T7 exclusion